MNYKKEIAKLAVRRKDYFVLITTLNYLYKTLEKSDLPFMFTEPSQIAIILEMIDLGYLDRESFNISREFGSITGLSYNGAAPVTEAGMGAWQRELLSKRKKISRLILIALAAAIAGIFLYIL